MNGNEVPGYGIYLYSPEQEEIVYEKLLNPVEMLETIVGNGETMIEKVLEYVDDYCLSGKEFDVDDFISYVSL